MVGYRLDHMLTNMSMSMHSTGSGSGSGADSNSNSNSKSNASAGQGGTHSKRGKKHKGGAHAAHQVAEEVEFDADAEEKERLESLAQVVEMLQ